MAKNRTVYVCNECAKEHSKWAGRCSECGEWNTLEEVLQDKQAAGSFGFGRQARTGTLVAGTNPPMKMSDIQPNTYERVALPMPEFTRVLGGGVVPGSLVLVGGDPGIGKCLHGDSRVLDPMTGAYLPITEWREVQRSVLAVEPGSLTLHPTSVAAFHEQGVRPVVEVKTGLGRTLLCTPDHPFLTPDGWQPLSSLGMGSRLAAPRALPYFGSEPMAEAELAAIAQALAEGAMAALPAPIFTLPKEQLLRFLKHFMEQTQRVRVNALAGLCYRVRNRRLAEDMHHLFLRFGILLALRPAHPDADSATTYGAYDLLAVERHRLTLSRRPVRGVPLRPTRARRVRSRELLATDGSYHAAPQLPDPESDIYWDEVVSVTPAGEAEVYDLTVPGRANFVANDLIVHNSTLLGQVSGLLADAMGPVLYLSGEESVYQVKMRAERLGMAEKDVYLLSETNLDIAIEHMNTLRPKAAIIDSIQTVYLSDLTSSAGSISQVRECAARLMQLAKGENLPIFLVGHVTKEGAIAGPRVLEHIVDTVLYLEGDRFNTFRLLRAQKNRFGSTNEVGVFEMVEGGMVEVPNPSEAFLSEHQAGATGSAVAVTMEGTRPLLVEIQSLVTQSAFSQPRRTANGIDLNRLHLLLAVLGKRIGLQLHTQDVFVNVVGGLKINEPAADLAIAAAIASSYREKAIPRHVALIGEIGLGGELRAVSQLDKRLNEAAKLGFTRCIVPRSGRRPVQVDGIEAVPVRTVVEALHVALQGAGKEQASDDD